MQIVTAIVNLARSVQVDVIAEGVTTPDQARALEKLGVTMGQGFLYAHPMPATEAERMLIRHGEVSNHR
jgi:EAL domain-containing protein (putative c-di-GMP-specific phosphodiesterase class I)